jgi:hypothetical protein
MQKRNLIKLLIFLFISFLIISFNGITMAKGKKGAPPKHAKAHGYRAKHTYQYYPEAKAYYDASRGSYFYLDGGSWRVSVSLPDSVKVRLGTSVTVEMESDKPYTEFAEHSRQYPPGHRK